MAEIELDDQPVARIRDPGDWLPKVEWTLRKAGNLLIAIWARGSAAVQIHIV
jgi:hypothetical protein